MPDWYIATAIGFAVLAAVIYSLLVIHDVRMDSGPRSRCGECGGTLVEHRCSDCGTRHNGPDNGHVIAPGSSTQNGSSPVPCSHCEGTGKHTAIPTTWDAYRLAGYPHAAYLATREQQIVVGKRVLAAQGWGAWPHCSRVIGVR